MGAIYNAYLTLVIQTDLTPRKRQISLYIRSEPVVLQPANTPLSYIPQTMPHSPRSFSPSVPLDPRAHKRAPALRKISPIAKSTLPVRSPTIAWPATV